MGTPLPKRGRDVTVGHEPTTVKTITDSYPQLLSLAVHEFRTPVSVVGGYLRMLQRDTESPLSERQRKMIDEAEKSCTRLVALIAELSELSKLDASQVTLGRQSLDVFTLVAEVADLVQEARDREVLLKVRGEKDGAIMSGDIPRLRTAFDAIFRAILREKAGPVTVIAERRVEIWEGRSAAVFVVAEEASVQAAYDRERGPFDEKRGGMGFALPLARRVIEGHGGQIWSPAADEENDPLRRGSVIVALPIG
jgi:two-component system, OmpR family, sensor histidine kinase SenX3